MNFPFLLFEFLIWGALAWTLLGAIVLLILLIRDTLKGKIW
jgi:hypothetical protein